jgi:site-specific DNA recombinase
VTGAGKARSGGWRIPAGNLEGLVIDRLRAFLSDQGELLATIQDRLETGTDRQPLIERACRLAEELTTNNLTRSSRSS